MSEPDQSSGGRIREIGNCEVLAKVGQGGMGTVFRARQKSLDRIVALKVLPPSVAKDATFIDRFQREARASAKFSHPHIVNGIDVGQDAATGLWYFVMEFVDGPSLKDVQKKRGTLPESEVLKLARQIAGALDCLAANGMVHRDIKPDNIMLNERGDAKLADLGLAKDLREDSSLTQSGRAVGTPYYMSPEQVRGETTGIDIRADIYALGGTLFHLLTGRPPFQGETSAVIMAKHLTEPPPLANKINASVSEGCARMIARMMAKKKEDRVQTPRELMDIIDKVVAGEYGMTTGGRAPIRGTGPRSAVKTKTSVREEKPRSFMVPAALAGVVVLGVGAYLAFGSSSKPVAQTPPKPAPVQQPKREETPKQKLSTPPPAAHTAPAPVAAATHENAKVAEKKPVAADTGAADEAWKILETRTQAASNGGDFDSALEVLGALPEAHAPLLLDRAEALAGKLRADAELRINAALKLAEDASARAEPKAGLEALAGIESTRYTPLAASVKSMKERLESEIANAGELKRRKEIQDARTHLAAHLARFEKALLEDRNVAAARSVADEAAKDARLAPIEHEAKALGEIVAAHEDYNARSAAACEVLKGRQIKINKDEGILGEVKDGVISLRIPGPGGANNFGIKKIKLADLTDAQRKDLLKVEWGTTAAANVAAAMQKLREPEDLPGASVLLANATDFPLHAVYDERLQVKLKGAEEVAAEKGWAALDEAVKKPLATPEQGQALMAVVNQYTEKYGATKFAKSRAEALGAVRSAAEKAITVNLIKNGDFEDNSPSGFALWKKEGGTEFLINEKARNGLHGYCMIGPGRIYQSLDVQPGQTYRLTCNVSGGGACAVVGSIQALGGPERDPKDQVISFVNGEPGNGSNWKTMEIVYTAHHPKLEVSFNHKSPGLGRIYLDDVLVTRVTKEPSGAPVAAVNKPTPPAPPQPAAAMPPQPATPAVNVFTNNGFEQGLTGWDVTRAAVHTDSPHTGRNCVQIQNKGRMTQTVKTEPGFTYLFSARVRGKGTAYFYLDRNERSYRELEVDEWSAWSSTFTATAATHSIEIGTRGTIYLDELSLVRGAPAKAGDDALLAAQLPPDFHVFKGHAYKVFKEAMSWPEAKKFCEKMGGHLAFIDDEREDEFLRDLARNSGKDVWIGLFDPQNTNQWVWSDGRKMTYNGFNERAIYKRTQARAARYAQFVGYEWAEDPIDKSYFFVCEWDTIPEKLLVKKPAAPPPAAAPQPTPKKNDE